MNQKNILVTGISGFVGPHLARELESRGCAVTGVGFSERQSAALADTSVSYISCDLSDMEQVKKIDFGDIDSVVHLAGLSSQGMSFDQPQRFIADNSAMLINLFEAALAQKPATLPRFVIISSGAVYNSRQAMPLSEQSEIAYASPYVVSKVTNEHLTAYYQSRGFVCVTARPFNHTGPGQEPGFLIPDLTAQVLVGGPDGTASVGNLETRRDYSDVRDIVRAYADMALAETVPHDLYNLASGVSRSGGEILDLIIRAVYGDTANITISVDQSKIRPNDPPDIYGDTSLALADLHWKPTYSIEQTITDYVAWLRQK